jgi:hypothetical protein
MTNQIQIDHFHQQTDGVPPSMAATPDSVPVTPGVGANVTTYVINESGKNKELQRVVITDPYGGMLPALPAAIRQPIWCIGQRSHRRRGHLTIGIWACRFVRVSRIPFALAGVL